MLQQDVEAIKAHLGEAPGGSGGGGGALAALQQQCADLAAALALVSERVEAREQAAAAEPGSNRAVTEDIGLLVDAVQVGRGRNGGVNERAGGRTRSVMQAAAPSRTDEQAPAWLAPGRHPLACSAPRASRVPCLPPAAA